MKRQGLYIHVPFCKSRCIYCDFYSTTMGSDSQLRFADAVAREMELRSSYLDSSQIDIDSPRFNLDSPQLDTIYMGGGTPSVLTDEALRRIFGAVARIYDISKATEVTVEVNPDDVTPEFAELLATLPVNRVSMGVQSFDDDMLRRLCRRHTSAQVVEAIENLNRAGIDNISIDLIYGLPGQTLENWQSDLDKAFALPVNHLSAYALIYEEGTAIYRMREQGLIREAEEELSLKMYETLMFRAAAEGMNHYEISNFARPGCEARHNTGYWRGMRYIGVGPGAHSYDGQSRQWNAPDLKAYIEAQGDVLRHGLYEREVLDKQMRMEESLLTSLRTAGGLDLSRFAEEYGARALDAMMRRANSYLTSGHLTIEAQQPQSFAIEGAASEGNFLCLTRKGLFISDDIISTLFE